MVQIGYFGAKSVIQKTKPETVFYLSGTDHHPFTFISLSQTIKDCDLLKIIRNYYFPIKNQRAGNIC